MMEKSHLKKSVLFSDRHQKGAENQFFFHDQGQIYSVFCWDVVFR